VVEELVEILKLTGSDGEEEQYGHSSSSDESLVHISLCAVAGMAKKKNLKLQGTVQDKEVLLLVDSGSFGNFVSSLTVQQLGL
jgi:hypothetical protein